MTKDLSQSTGEKGPGCFRATRARAVGGKRVQKRETGPQILTILAHDKVMAPRLRIVDRNIKAVGDNVKSMGDAATQKWTALKTKNTGDLQSMKSDIAQKKHDFDARRAGNYADSLEWEASLAVDYAIAAVDQAESAVLDAVAGRIEAAKMQRA